MKRGRRTAVLWMFVLLMTCPAGLSVTAAQEAVFRSRVALGTIDVSVIDRDGNPLADLTPDELIVRVDGHRREVRSVAPLGIAAPAISPVVRGARGTASNRDGGEVVRERRMIVVLFDDLSFEGFEGRALTESASRFIEARPRDDLVGVFSTSGLGTQVFPTTDRAPAVRALRQFVGQRRVDVRNQDDIFVALTEAVSIASGDARMFQEVFDRECPATGLRPEVCEQMISDRAMIFAVDLRERTNRQIARVEALIRAVRNQAKGAQLVLLTRGIAETGGDVPARSLARAAAAQNVSIFALHQTASAIFLQARRVGSDRSDDRALERGGLQNLVGATGGTILPVVGTADRHFSSLGRQLDSIQRVGFALEPEDERHGDRRVQITTTRRGVRVIPAERLMSFATAAVASEVEAVTPEGRLEHLLTSSAVSNAIPITARAFVARDPQGRGLRLTLAASADADEPLRAAFALHAANGAKIAGGTSPGMIEPAGGSVPLDFTTVVPPGDYMLRLAVLSEAGAVGTLVYSFRARLTVAGALVVSDPLVWAGDARKPVHSASDRIATATGLHARIEAYPSGAASVEGHALVVSVVSPGGGPSLVTTRVPLAVDADGAAATAWLPVDALSTGDYTLLTTIERDGAVVQRIERPFSLEKLTVAPVAPPAPETAAPIPAPASPAPFVPAAWLDEGGLAAVTDAFGRAGIGLSATTLTALSTPGVATAMAAHTVEALLIRTVTALRTGQLDLAASSLDALTRQLKSSPAVLALTGAVYAARGHDREAAGAWATAEAAGADDPAIRVAAVDALRRLGAHQEAESLLSDALARWPAHPGVKARAKK